MRAYLMIDSVCIWQYDEHMKRQAIYNAALKLFALKGYEGCSLQELADTVGINKATLYNYYHSKEELFLTILENEISSYIDAVKKAVDDHIEAPLESVLFEVIKAFVDNSTTDRLLLWKKTLLMAVSALDERIQLSSRKIMFEKNDLIMKIFGYLFSAKNIDMSDPKVILFMRSYYVFLQSVLDWVLLNDYRIKISTSISLEELWDNFWNGSRLA